MTSLLLDMASGFASASISKLFAHPFENAKLMVQLQHFNDDRDRSKDVGGFFAYVLRTPIEEQVLGLGVSILRYVPTQLLNMALKPTMQTVCRRYLGTGVVPKVLSGALAGSVALLVAMPLDTVRTLQVAATHLPVDERDFIGILTRRIADGGVSSLYAGLGVSLAGLIAYRAVYFLGYDMLMGAVPRDERGRRPFVLQFAVGFGVTIAAGVATYGFDTVRRVQMIHCVPRTLTPSLTALGAVSLIYSRDGIGGFFQGATINIFRGLAAALALSLFDMIKPN
jgi:solute carrier family 25 (mitochondrial adenine nucleotide translocator), member 4/5/6/31